MLSISEGVAPGYSELCLPGTGALTDTGDVTTLLIGHEATHVAPLPGGQYSK